MPPLRVKSPLFIAAASSLLLGFVALAFPEFLNYLIAFLLIAVGITGLYWHIKTGL